MYPQIFFLFVALILLESVVPAPQDFFFPDQIVVTKKPVHLRSKPSDKEVKDFYFPDEFTTKPPDGKFIFILVFIISNQIFFSIQKTQTSTWLTETCSPLNVPEDRSR